MSLPNTRVVVTGHAKVDAAFDVVEINAKETARLAKDVATQASRAKADILRALQSTTLSRR